MIPPLPRSPKLVVTSLLDASEPNLEPLVVNTADDFEKSKSLAGDDLHLTARLYRVGSSREEKNAKGEREEFWSWTFGLPLLGNTLRKKLETSPTEKESRIAHNRLSFSDWAGMRLFHFTGEGKRGDQLSAVESGPEVSPKFEQYGADLRKNLTQWPSSHQIVHMFGHGQGAHGFGATSVVEMGQTLKSSTEQAGRKADVVLMESCLMGSLEAATQFALSANFLLASEKILDFPVRVNQPDERLVDAKDLAQATQASSPEELAQGLFEAAAARPVPQMTLGLYDLNKLSSQLLPRLEGVAEKCLSELESPEKQELFQSALGRTPIVSHDWTLLDLGGFLRELHQEDLRPETKEALKAAREALAETVVRSKLHGEGQAEALEGLSFADPRYVWPNDQGQAMDSGLPGIWKEFMAKLGPEIPEQGRINSDGANALAHGPNHTPHTS